VSDPPTRSGGKGFDPDSSSARWLDVGRAGSGTPPGSTDCGDRARRPTRVTRASAFAPGRGARRARGAIASWSRRFRGRAIATPRSLSTHRPSRTTRRRQRRWVACRAT
jgi:hypothetical protein